jgi:murein L,D-transpeptidase YafK
MGLDAVERTMVLKSFSLTPLLLALTACVATITLAGCASYRPTDRALQPLSPQMVAQLERKHMPINSPILIRLFKEESEAEVWKQDTSGRFALLKTYPICRWSGELGPKLREGDRQAPEGFYIVKPGQMNPNSHEYLSFDIGYPNAYDRAYGRTGGDIMMHGGCSSAGCYAMTDEQIAEIYALARESFSGDQRSFQVQAFPFRMTPLNMVKHLDNPNVPFWKILKEGNDHFEVTHLAPKVDVCEKRYVFDADPVDGMANAAPTSISFNPTAWCPAYKISNEIALAVAEKNRRDEGEMAELISRDVSAVVPGGDAGMQSPFRTGQLASDSLDVNSDRYSELGAVVRGAH